MYKTIVGPDGKVIEVSDINYPDVKADTYTTEEVIDMLKELRAEIEELYPKARKAYKDGLTSYCEGVDDSRDIVQEKINALKEGQE